MTVETSPPTARVLDVGNCDLDHPAIRGMLASQFDVAVDRARVIDEAKAALRERAYDLVLVNRRIDADNADGLDLVRHIRSEPGLARTPIMLISNHGWAQQAAIACGAEEGFGKDALNARSTLECLSRFLPRRSGPPTAPGARR